MALPAKVDLPPATDESKDRDELYAAIVAEGHRDVLKELERLRSLGIIDEQGHLLKRAHREPGEGGDAGGWG